MVSRPAEYPVIEPSDPTTLWQGITRGKGLRAITLPTARAALGLPALRASSEYESFSPGFVSITVSETFRAKGLNFPISTGKLKTTSFPDRYSVRSEKNLFIWGGFFFA